MRRDETRKISVLKQHKTYLHSIAGKPQFFELSLARCYIQCRRSFILIFNHLIKKLCKQVHGNLLLQNHTLTTFVSSRACRAIAKV